MNQLWPVVIPQPQHGTAVGAEVALRRATFLVWSSAVFNSSVFSACMSLAPGFDQVAFLGNRGRRIQSEGLYGKLVLDQVLALQHFKAIRDAAQVHTATVAADFATDAAGA